MRNKEESVYLALDRADPALLCDALAVPPEQNRQKRRHRLRFPAVLAACLLTGIGIWVALLFCMSGQNSRPTGTDTAMETSDTDLSDTDLSDTDLSDAEAFRALIGQIPFVRFQNRRCDPAAAPEKEILYAGTVYRCTYTETVVWAACGDIGYNGILSDSPVDYYTADGNLFGVERKSGEILYASVGDVGIPSVSIAPDVTEEEIENCRADATAWFSDVAQSHGLDVSDYQVFVQGAMFNSNGTRTIRIAIRRTVSDTEDVLTLIAQDGASVTYTIDGNAIYRMEYAICALGSLRDAPNPDDKLVMAGLILNRTEQELHTLQSCPAACGAIMECFPVPSYVRTPEGTYAFLYTFFPCRHHETDSPDPSAEAFFLVIPLDSIPDQTVSD